MTTYQNLSTALGATAAISLTLNTVILLQVETQAPLWQTVLLIGLPLAMLFVVWRFLRATERKHSLEDQNASERKQAVGAVYAVCIAILGAQALAVAKMLGALAGVASDQLFGIAVGIFAVILGNAWPKVAFSERTLKNRKLTAPAAQAANRFSGLAVMLAGVGMILVWTLLPHGPARLIAPTLLVAALIASFTKFLLVRRA